MDDVDILRLKPEQINKTRRYRDLSKLDAYYHSCQYKGLPDFWKGEGANGQIVPLRERAPCIVYPLPKACVNQAVRFTLGEGRFPDIKVEPGVVTDSQYADIAVTPDEAETLTSYIAQLAHYAKFHSRMRTLMRRGLSTGTGVAVIALRDGMFDIDLPQAPDCWPVFTGGRVGNTEAMTICYEYEKLVEEKGELAYKRYYYRRDIDDQVYRVFHDAEVKPEGQRVEWREDPSRSVAHGLGFCPTVWSRNLPDPYCSDIDGVSLYCGLLDEFDSLNFALSQRHRGIVYFGTPQPWETGVKKGEGPLATGRTATPRSSDNKVDPFHVQTRAARKASPDQVWSYDNPETKLGLMETSGKSFQVATEHVHDIRERLLEAMNIVLLDQMKVTGSGDISAKALALMYAPLLALVDELRECWWTQALEPVLSMALRIVAHTGGEGILIPRSGEVARILSRFNVAMGEKMAWVAPRMLPIWGDYFSPLNSEVQEAVVTANQAVAGGLISKKTGTTYVASYFGVGDVAREIDAVEEEADEEQPEISPAKKPDDRKRTEQKTGDAGQASAAKLGE